MIKLLIKLHQKDIGRSKVCIYTYTCKYLKLRNVGLSSAILKRYLIQVFITTDLTATKPIAIINRNVSFCYGNTF
jgi:hypothetical protein